MVWDYRVIRKKLDNEVYFEIHEVYYDNQLPEFTADRDRTICGLTEEASSPFGETPEELKKDLEMMIGAFDKPILDFCKNLVGEHLGGT